MYRLSFILMMIMAGGFVQAQNPHGDNLKIDCKVCHSPDSWTFNRDSSSFLHASTGFVLEGAHKNADCTDCHKNLNFTGTENECIACHTDVHSMSVGNDCVRCHNADNWLVDNIPELHEENGFPLHNQHKLADCVDCHKSETNLRWDRIGNNCASCHMPSYNTSTNPNHITAGFSTECAQCHDPEARSWNGSGDFHFYFPLVGGHDISDCSKCHDVTNFSNISPECYYCHKSDYEGVTSIDHIAGNFSKDCTECHSMDAWTPATLKSHDAFPLTGVHDIADCAKCHDVTDYSNISSDCVSCHLNDYNNATSVDHVGANFSKNCLDCHNLNGWSPALFEDHDAQFFPVFSGKHAGTWNTCDECHTTAGDYSAFSCIDCHEHSDKAKLDNKHDGEKDYVYQSDACFDCHPKGKE